MNNFINYENDNFFETDDDRLIATRKILDAPHFWERIDAFFKVNLPEPLLNKVANFYKLRADQLRLLHAELTADPMKLTGSMKSLLRNNDRDLCSTSLEEPVDERDAKALQKDAQEMQEYYRESLIESHKARIEEECDRQKTLMRQYSRRLDLSIAAVEAKQPVGLKSNDQFIEKIQKPRNRIQWQLFNSKVLFNQPSNDVAARQIDYITSNPGMYVTTIDAYYANCNPRNSNMQISQDIERIYLMQPRPEVVQQGIDEQPALDELEHTIKLLIKETTKLKAINALAFSGELPAAVKRQQMEEKHISRVDIKQKLRDIKKFLKKRKANKAKREGEDSQYKRQRLEVHKGHGKE